MLNKNFRQKISCDVIDVPEHTIEKGVDDNAENSSVNDAEKFLKALIL